MGMYQLVLVRAAMPRLVGGNGLPSLRVGVYNESTSSLFSSRGSPECSYRVLRKCVSERCNPPPLWDAVFLGEFAFNRPVVYAD